MSQILTTEFPLSRYTLAAGTAYGRYELDDAAELCEFMYRIREWQVDVNVAGPPPASTPFGLNGTYTVFTRGINNTGAQSGYPTNERELVLEGVFAEELGGRILYSVFPDDLDFNLYPFFEVTTVAGVQTAWSLQCFFSANGILTTDSSGNMPNGVTMTIRGHPVQLYDPTGEWSGTVIATPITWWAAAPTSGGLPVFDTTTGAQINPNVVID